MGVGMRSIRIIFQQSDLKESIVFGLGTTELIVIGVIIFLIFGAKRLPEIGKGLGGAVREFKNVKKDLGLKADAKTDEESDRDRESTNPIDLETRLSKKVMEQIPVVKKAMDVKKKVEKIKKII